MDEYYAPDNMRPTSKEMKNVDRVQEIGIDSWGTTTNPFEHQTEALKARIFHGANKIEFAFFGHGKGNKQGMTPETFGKRERQDMRELAEFNEVETTTHATVGVSGLSGFSPQQGTFDDRQRKESMDEVKRAIHFAAEATTGGAIVFHTGEAFRSMRSPEYMQDKEGRPMFEFHPDEDKREQFYLADPLTKRIVPLKRNDKIAVPIIQRENGGYKYLKDKDGNYVTIKELEKRDPIHQGRVPIYDLEEDGTIKVEMMTFNEWEDYRKKEYKMSGKPIPQTIDLVKDFYRVQAINQVQYYMNFGRLHKGQYEELLDKREKLMKALDFYEDLKKKVPKDEWWKYERQMADQFGGGFLPSETRDPVEYLQEQIASVNNHINRTTEYDIMGKRQSLETLDSVERMKSASDFAVEETSRSMAELGVYAWQKTREAKKKQKEGESAFGLKHDLYIAPENVFPEAYGGHPDELKNLIQRGREEMKKELVSKWGFKGREKEAENLAKHHIKATFDIGHANIWYKYFKAKDGEEPEQKRERFNKWLLGETKKLLNDGIIGHIHVSDNYGFHDEHLVAGDGNAPIKEFIKMAKENGLNEFIVESGTNNAMTSLPDTWMHFDSPVYNIHVPGFTRSNWTEPSLGPSPYGWNNFYRSYFGRTEGPRFVVGEYAPSEEFKGAPFYSGMPLE